MLNNPLSYTDPSGYFFGHLFKAIKHIVSGVVKAVNGVIHGVSNAINNITGGNQLLKLVAVIAAAYYTGNLAIDKYANYVAKLGGVAQNGAQAAFVTHLAASTTAKMIGGAVGGFVAGAILGGDLKSALTGAVTGAAMGGIAGHFGSSWNAQRVLANSAVGGISSELNGGKFKDGFLSNFVSSSLTLANYRLRQIMIKNSSYDPRNISGKSIGLDYDGYKIGGGRYNALRAFDYLRTPGSPLGGWQGGSGRIFWFKYKPGSFWDRLVESYAGPHDYLNHGYWYDSMGDIDVNVAGSPLRSFIGERLNELNVLPATTLAVPALVNTTPQFYSVTTTFINERDRNKF